VFHTISHRKGRSFQLILHLDRCVPLQVANLRFESSDSDVLTADSEVLVEPGPAMCPSPRLIEPRID